MYEGESIITTVVVELRYQFFVSEVKIDHQDVSFFSLLDELDAIGHYYSLLKSYFLSTNIYYQTSLLKSLTFEFNTDHRPMIDRL